MFVEEDADFGLGVGELAFEVCYAGGYWNVSGLYILYCRCIDFGYEDSQEISALAS